MPAFLRAHHSVLNWRSFSLDDSKNIGLFVLSCSDLSTLSKEDLTTKILELQQRAVYLSYHRPFDAIHLQLQNLIRVYSNELANRNTQKPLDQ